MLGVLGTVSMWMETQEEVVLLLCDVHSRNLPNICSNCPQHHSPSHIHFLLLFKLSRVVDCPLPASKLPFLSQWIRVTTGTGLIAVSSGRRETVKITFIFSGIKWGWYPAPSMCYIPDWNTYFPSWMSFIKCVKSINVLKYQFNTNLQN